MRKALLGSAIIAIFLSNCSTSNKVVERGILKKRKYNNGYYLDILTHGKKVEVKKNDDRSNYGQNNGKSIKSKESVSESFVVISKQKNDYLISDGERIKNLLKEKEEKLRLSCAINKISKQNNESIVKFNKTDKLGIIFVSPSSETTKGNSAYSIVSFVTGIVSILVCWIPYIGLILGIIAIVFGALGLKQENTNKGLAIAGLVCGIVGFLLALWPIFFDLLFFEELFL